VDKAGLMEGWKNGWADCTLSEFEICKNFATLLSASEMTSFSSFVCAFLKDGTQSLSALGWVVACS